MKTIILHPNSATRELIRRQIDHLGHLVLHEDSSLRQILLAVAKYRPHFIVAAASDPALRSRIETIFVDLKLGVPILWPPSELVGTLLEEWLSMEITRISNTTGIPPLTRYTDDSRDVIRDEEYEAHEDGKKRNLPSPSENLPGDLADEMAIFARQVERAVDHHTAAQHYLRQVLLTDKGLRVEVAYRAVHSSHKIFWLREHIFRWIGVLAHYLPGVEPTYLPPPAPPSPKLDFLHYSPPPESFYAATAVLIHGFKPSWMPTLRCVLDHKFTGQDEAALLNEALLLMGWSSLLRDIALAQVRVMDCALHPDVPWYANGLPSRAIHRATGIFCDFWNLRQLRTNPRHLRPVANGAVIDGVETPGTLSVVPPFRHYVEALSRNRSETKKLL